MTTVLAASPAVLLVTSADSVRAATQIYCVSLLATAPLIVAAVGVLLLRGAPAGVRSLLSRSAVVALVVVCAGRLLPLFALTLTVPGLLAAPLVALGEVQLAAVEAVAPLVQGAGASATVAALGEAHLIRFLVGIYVMGVVAVLGSIMLALVETRRLRHRSRPLRDASWERQLALVRLELGVRRLVQLRTSSGATVPLTWGVFRPVVLLPATVLGWTAEQRRAVLLHEVAHVARRDTLFGLLARFVCGLLWWHPGVWWLARSLAADAEQACDERVLSAGVRRSDYAELLLMATAGARHHATWSGGTAAMALRPGLRERLAAITDCSRRAPLPSPASARLAAVVTLAFALPLGSVQLAPTRDVLTSLMQDTRWESRAYAVTGLAQRRDSVEVARTAARLDPSPRVRAWALRALSQPRGRDLAALLAP